LIELPRFRAGYDFLVLRAQSGEIEMEIADWWHDFQNADHEAREALLIPESGPKKRRRRARGKKPAGEGDSAGGGEIRRAAKPDVGRRCFVALGANLGDPVRTVRAAILALRELPQTEFIAASSLYRTAPVGLRHQPDFINAVVELIAVSPAPTFLEALFEIEARFGRQRSVKNAPRTLDLDLLLYGDEVRDDPQLTLPHPRLHERAFVLAPLAEIAPHLVIPGRGRVADLLLQCADQRIES
jgi:2-amino-4-hydroxy-6-hydroxymethyldihydropteridine diphosphokinase